MQGDIIKLSDYKEKDSLKKADHNEVIMMRLRRYISENDDPVLHRYHLDVHTNAAVATHILQTEFLSSVCDNDRNRIQNMLARAFDFGFEYGKARACKAYKSGKRATV